MYTRDRKSSLDVTPPGLTPWRVSRGPKVCPISATNTFNNLHSWPLLGGTQRGTHSPWDVRFAFEYRQLTRSIGVRQGGEGQYVWSRIKYSPWTCGKYLPDFGSWPYDGTPDLRTAIVHKARRYGSTCGSILGCYPPNSVNDYLRTAFSAAFIDSVQFQIGLYGQLTMARFPCECPLLDGAKPISDSSTV